MTLLNIEDNFQRCITNAESYLADCRRETSSIRSSRKSGRYSVSSSSTRSEKFKFQDFTKRERRNPASWCFEKIAPREKKIVYGDSAVLKNDTATNQEWQEFKTPTHTLNTLIRAPLQTPLIPECHIFPYPPNVAKPKPPAPDQDSRAEIRRREAEPQMEKNMPTSMRLPLNGTRQLTFGGENIIALGKFSGKKELWPRFIQTFKAVVDNQPYEPIVKLAILEQHVIGLAKDCIKGFPFDEKSYPLVLKTLEDRFGDDDDHAAFHLGAIEDLPRVKERETSSLRKFYDDLKLTFRYWKLKEPTYKEDRSLGIDIRLLCEWLRRRVKILEKADVRQSCEPKPKHSIHAALSSGRDTTDSRRCWLCKENHTIYKCQRFEKMNVETRKQEVRNKGACFRCLHHGHMARNCRTNMNDKGKKTWTHPMLRTTSNTDAKDTRQDAGTNDLTRTASENQSTVAMTTKTTRGCTGLPVKMVTVMDRSGKRVQINCLEDPGSQVSLVTAKIANSLDLKQEKSNVTLSGIGNEDLRARTSVALQITTSCGTSFFNNAYVVKKISHHLPNLNVNRLKENYSHLEHVEVQLVDGPIDLLIGQDFPSLLRQLEVSYGEKDEPYAVTTALGWSICGPLTQLDDRPSVHVLCSLEDEPESVDYTLRKFWEIETIAKDIPANGRLAAIEEQTKRTTVQVGNRYQVRLPWKKGVVTPSGSYGMALKRLSMTERRLENNLELKKKYHLAMEEYFKEGYADRIEGKPTEEGWYLPHHPVVSETKNTKVRIVFDSAAKVKGVSLNDLLEKGPNLLNDLTGILLRFRRYRYAIAGDISKMFLQILLSPEDQIFHRFLWRKDPKDKPEIYQFKSVIFGDAPSPFLACYVIKRVLEEHNGSNGDVFNALNRNLYMDDLLHSCPSIAEARDIVKGTCGVLEKGGFRMRNWISNDQRIFDEMTEERMSSNLEKIGRKSLD
eukprot:gene2620-3033_t